MPRDNAAGQKQEHPAQPPIRDWAPVAHSPVQTDEIHERYLQKAIAEINELGDELQSLGDETHVPVLGSGHPLGDIFLLKLQTATDGDRGGGGVLRSRRSGVAQVAPATDSSTRSPSTAPTASSSGPRSRSRRAAWLTRELHIVQPRLVVAMGEETVGFLASLAFPLADPLDTARIGEVQRFTPTIDGLVTPDIDDCLDEQAAKTRFWNAFKALGTWWSELPPY